MKSEVRILGVDDAPFVFEDASCMVVGVVMRGGSYVEAVLRSDVKVDGLDATKVLVKMISDSRYREQLHAILLDGASLAGFNVVDIEGLYEKTGVPVISVTRDSPDFDAMKKALQAKCMDWEKRWEWLNKGEVWRVKTRHNPLYVRGMGVSCAEAQEIITLATIRGALPEPVRLAHIIASGIVRGESYGKA